MFKRITKKQQRRERDEELGLDDDAKQMFGLQDTDSDESGSDSNSDLELNIDDGSDNDLDHGSASGMRTEWLAAEGGDSEDEDESDEEELDLEEELDDDPLMSLDEAIKNPIYPIPSSKWNERACIACPKKVLKYDNMVESHLASAAHVRRFKKFCELARNTKNRSKDPRRVASASSLATTPVLNAEGLSNRAAKRKQKLDAVKKKRDKTKRIIERKKKKSAKNQEDVETTVQEKGEKKRKSRDTGKTDVTSTTLSHSDKPSSERPKKRRKLSGAETAPQGSGGGDSPMPEDDHTTPVKSSKKTKTKAKAKASPKAPEVHGAADDVDSTSKPKGKGKVAEEPIAGATVPKVRFFEDDGAIKGGNAHSMKKRDVKKMKTKGHMGREHAGRFAKLSETRGIKDKSKRKPRHDGKDMVRKSSLAPGKTARYFDGPDDDEVGPKKTSVKKGKSEVKKRGRAAKDVGANRAEKAQSRWTEKAPDDLVIFD